MAAANGSMSTRKASWPSSEASGTKSVAVPALVERLGKGVLLVDGEQDVGLHADDQRAFRRGAFQRGRGVPPCAERSKRSMARDR